MGYTLRIGDNVNGKIEVVRHSEAPAFGEPTDYTNERWPSYTAWWGFVRACGLDAMFTSLLDPHPGINALTPDHLRALEAVDMKRLDEWCQNRLTWLLYWTRWALANCNKPAISNS